MKAAAVKISDLVIKSNSRSDRLNITELIVPQAELTVLLGSSGSGKTTLIRSCLGLENEATGSVLVTGVEAITKNQKTLKKLRKKAGYVQQSSNLIERITAFENVLIGALAELRFPRIGVALYPKKAKDKAKELMSQLGVFEFASQIAQKLSGGQKQRVAIGRALMHDPVVLFADEPISALDVVTGDQTLRVFRSLVNHQKITVVVALHQIDAALNYADNLVVLSHGKVIYAGPAEQVSRTQLVSWLNE